MKTKKVAPKKLVSERIENPFEPVTLTRKEVSEKMSEVNNKKKSILDQLKEERSFFGCIRYISKNAARPDIDTFFKSINNEFHVTCIINGEIDKKAIEYFNSIKSAKLIETETLKPKKTFSVNYIIEVFRTNFKDTLNTRVVRKAAETKQAKIARLQAELAKLTA